MNLSGEEIYTVETDFGCNQQVLTPNGRVLERLASAKRVVSAEQVVQVVWETHRHSWHSIFLPFFLPNQVGST